MGEKDLTADKTQPIPAVFQYIWVGGNIYDNYLTSIKKLAAKAAKDGFKVILWTDDEKHINRVLLNKEQQALDIPIEAKHLGIEIRNINELLERLKQDPIFSDQEKNEFIYGLLKESIGHKNLAAVSDLLRFCCLYYYGGYYLDTDLKLQIDHSVKLAQDRPRLGIIGNFRQMAPFAHYIPAPREIDGNTDCIGALAKHPVMRVTISRMLDMYRQLAREHLVLKDLGIKSMEQSGYKLAPFSENFLQKLCQDKNKTLKAAFVNSLLDLSFDLRLLNQENKSPLAEKRTPEEIKTDKKTARQAIDQLIYDTAASILDFNPSEQDVVELRTALLHLIDFEVSTHQKKHRFGYEKATELDAKRYPHQTTDSRTNKRRRNTILTGVNTACDAIRDFLLHHDATNSPFSAQEMEKFPTEELTADKFKVNARSIAAKSLFNGVGVTVANLEIELNCDKTWLQTSEERPSYDDSALPPRRSTFFKDENNESQINPGKEEEKPIPKKN